MPAVWDLNTEQSITFDELIAHFDALGADVLVRDVESSAAMLRRLYNNRTFLVEILHRQIQDMPTFERINGYTSQVFILHRSTHYFVRAALWMNDAGKRSDEVFLYEDAHDHNFNLLTLGYVGSGYRTRVFEYDHAAAIGYPGEAVPVRYCDTIDLSAGRVLLFRESRDIHVQFPPSEFSISVNIISTGSQHVPQYAFDLNLDPSTTSATIRKTLVGYMPATFARFAQAMGVKDLTNRLGTMLDSPLRDPARLAIYTAMAEIDGDAAWRTALADCSAAIQAVARMKLDRCDA
jgi:hypothetical protein